MFNQTMKEKMKGLSDNELRQVAILMMHQISTYFETVDHENRMFDELIATAKKQAADEMTDPASPQP